jgi:predicted SAM-dependent methyltransferase
VTAREFRNRCLPFATRHAALAVLNPVLRPVSPRGAVRRRLQRLLQRHGIEYLDLGGWMPVEGYVTIHLSPVEAYGLPRVPVVTQRQVFDEARGVPTLVPRRLEGPAVSLHFDVLGGLPLADDCLRGVNLSHFLEHFDIETGAGLLRECCRVLRPGGVIRVSCPDLKKYARAYVDGDAGFYRQMATRAYCNYRRLPTHGAVFAGKAYDGDNGHKWFYDAETVMDLLKDAGCSRAEERRLHDSALPRIGDVEPAYRAVESFYVEGIR